MVKKIRIFVGDQDKVEDEVNDFLATVDHANARVVSVNYATEGREGTIGYSRNYHVVVEYSE